MFGGSLFCFILITFQKSKFPQDEGGEDGVSHSGGGGGGGVCGGGQQQDEGEAQDDSNSLNKWGCSLVIFSNNFKTSRH